MKSQRRTETRMVGSGLRISVHLCVSVVPFFYAQT